MSHDACCAVTPAVHTAGHQQVDTFACHFPVIAPSNTLNLNGYVLCRHIITCDLCNNAAWQYVARLPQLAFIYHNTCLLAWLGLQERMTVRTAASLCGFSGPQCYAVLLHLASLQQSSLAKHW